MEHFLYELVHIFLFDTKLAVTLTMKKLEKS